MATFIPRTPGPQVQVQQGPQVRDTTRVDDSGGQAIARGLQQMAGVASDFAQRIQERNDTAALMSARRELSEWENATFDPGNPDGINRFKGLNALEANDVILPDLQKRVSEISERLTPRQRQQFESIALNFEDGIGSRLNTYMDREHSAAIQAEQRAAVENLGRDAVLAGSAGDLDRQDMLLAELTGMAEASLRGDGMGDEAVRSAQRSLVSSVRRQTIEASATANPFHAQELLERYRDDLLPEDVQKVENTLFPVIQDEAIRTQVDQLFSGVVVGADAPDDVDAAIIAMERGATPDARNPDSTATGDGQFIEGTWLDMLRRHRPDLADGRSREELLAMRSDPALSREMVSAYRRENAAHLQSRGVSTTTENLYAAHHFGPGGGVKFGRASADTPMSDILTPGQLAANSYLRGKTKGEVLSMWQRRGLPVSGMAGAAPPASTSEADMIEWVQQNVRDPRVRSGMVSEIRSRFAITEMREREQTKANYRHVYETLENADDPNRPLRDLIGAEAYAWAVSEGKVETFENLRMNKVRGTFVQDDPALVEVLSREAVLSPNTFKDRNIYELVDRLSTPTLANFLQMQADINKPGTQADWSTADERLSRGFTMVGIGREEDARGSGSDKKNAERNALRGQFRLAFQNAERALIQTKGGQKPTPAELDSLLANVARDFAQRMEDETTDVYQSAERFHMQVSPEERRRVREAYRQKYGTMPSEAWVTMYIADYYRGEQ